MKSGTPLDYAVFQLSPKRTRCDFFVSSDGNVEKLASGLVQPFANHLKVVEEQLVQAAPSIKLEVEKLKHGDAWFTKGTLERFLQFVSTPEVLESVNTLDVEMSQLEAARKIYSQGTGDQHSGVSGGDGTGAMAVADATKKELLRAIDVRLEAVRQDFNMACDRASSAGFNPYSVSELQQFANRFGAYRLIEACTRFTTLCQRRLDLVSSWHTNVDDLAIRASWGSDMSIDDPTENQPGPHKLMGFHQPTLDKHLSTSLEQPNATQTQHLIDQSKLSMSSQPKSNATFSAQKHSQGENSEEDKKVEGLTESSIPQVSQSSRRLSVQDRINLFENKQKETSGGKSIAVGKPAELRRLSSDVSPAPTLAEKAVLRRWSGASDMSIDLSYDKKDSNIDSPLCTPPSSSVSLAKSISGLTISEDKNQNHKGLSNSLYSGSIVDSGLKDKDQKIYQREVQESIPDSCLEKEDVVFKEEVNQSDEVGSHDSQLRSLTGRTERDGLGEQRDIQENRNSYLGGEENAGFKEQVSALQAGFIAGKSQPFSRTHVGDFVGRMGDSKAGKEFTSREEEVELSDQLVTRSHTRECHSHSRSFSGQHELGSNLKTKEVQYRGSDSDQLAPQTQWRSLQVGTEQVGKELSSFENQTGKKEDSGLQRMKNQKIVVSAAPDEIKKSQSRRDGIGTTYGNSQPESPKISESHSVQIEQVQRIRQSKGGQERNDELKMKANELEKLFAEHQLRASVDQSSSARRSRPAETQTEQISSLSFRKAPPPEIPPPLFPDKSTRIQSSGSSSKIAKFNTPPITKGGDNQNYGDTLRRNFSAISLSYDSRGKFYDRYMQKRDAKLREEWGSNRPEKEAKLKAMQDDLELSRAEMKLKLSGSTGRQDSVTSARRRTERLRSFNSTSNLKREQHPISYLQSAEDDDVSEFLEQNYYGQDRLSNELLFGDGASRSSQTKKPPPSRNTSLSTPRTSAVPVTRLSAKVSTTSSVRRRGQSENPMAQSVPNFSDLRKENTKPSSGVGKTTTRSQLRNYSRSRSNSEDVPPVKEENTRRSQSLRKSSVGSTEFTDLSALNSDEVLIPLEFEKEQSEPSLQDKFMRKAESKPFLRKGNGIGPGTGSRIAKLKATMASESEKNEKEHVLDFEVEDSVDMAREEEEEELGTMGIEDGVDMDNRKERMSQESEKSGNSGSEIGDSFTSHSQVDPDLVSELPAVVPLTYNTGASLQESPGESPMSWNSRMHHPFSYPHETSDIDASVDSPMGSPASWNSHSLTQTEADVAARMRKKWGSAQKPILVSQASHNQSRKDVTKGFKRLLKFGRKTRGTDNLVDWISATTSEGDDDTEDGRDPANRSTDDLRKSRMGFLPGHPSDDGFNESELFSEHGQALSSSIPAPPANFKLREDHLSGSSIKAPRSFFSLSTFRSKGSDSKPR